MPDSPKRQNIEPHNDEAEMLYILGIVPLATLREIAENIILIRKGINFGSVFLEVEKGEIEWVGVKMKKRTIRQGASK